MKNIKKAIKREEENETNIFIVEAALLIEDKYDEICDELWYYNGYSSCSCRSSNTRYSSIGHAYGYNYCSQYEFRN